MHSRRGIIVGAISLLGLTGIADLRAAEDRPASFDCSKDRGQLAVTVCSDRTLIAGERRTTVNYLAVYFSLGDESRTSFRNDHIQWLNGLTVRCASSPNLRPLGADQGALSVECLRRSYTQRGDLYHKRLSGAALEESNLSPALLKKIQKRLADLKFLSGNVDGVFGADTRTAIKSYQASVGHAQGNFLTSQERNMLLASNAPPAATSLPKQTPVTAQQTPVAAQPTPIAAQQTPAAAPESASEAAPAPRSTTQDLQSADSRPHEPDTTERTAEPQQNTAEAANPPADADTASLVDTGGVLQTRYFIAGAGLAVVILAFAAVFVFVRLRRRTKRTTGDDDIAAAFGAPASVSLKTEALRPSASTNSVAAVARDAQHVDADAPLAPERVVELLPHLEKGAKP